MKKRVSARQVVLTSFVVDLSDVILNCIITIMSGSVVMLSQAIQGAADLLTSGFLLLGLQRSKRRANRDNRFGYGRELYFWSFLSASVMLVFTAGLSFAFGFQRFLHPEPVDNLLISFLTLIFGLGTNGYALNLSYQRLKQDNPNRSLWHIIRHPDLVETKTTLVLDSMGTIAAVFGIIALGLYAVTGNQAFDGIGAMIIGLSIAFLSFFLVIEIKDLIIGKSAPKEIEDLIRGTVRGFTHIHDVLDLRTMYMGTDRILINLEVHVEDGLTTDEIELLIDKVKAKLKQEIPSAHHIQIELETPVISAVSKSVSK